MSWAVEPRVPGLNQLVVIPPGTHERGLPAVRTESVGDGYLAIDIPPTLHVHRYYYSGDQEFQGPILQGGPTIVVANHPKTGERMYVNVTLPPGAPVVSYNKKAITYVYSQSRVVVEFCRGKTECVAVKYYSGKGALRRTHEISESILAKTRDCCSGSATCQSLKVCASSGGRLLVGGQGAIDSATGKVLDGAKRFGQAIPGMTALRSLGDQRDERINQAMIRAAELEKERSALRFAPTNR